ncbi:ArsA family ATPase [Pseudidiomarina sp. CB1]|uniref:ArsA family ATPase n=1 Tax=Pseudidiomarina sp. CB1 TaxID=2972484 RepID=UPI0021628B1C|nr:ArsA family ATPase [Pseudidiomarina sp. CB1]
MTSDLLHAPPAVIFVGGKGGVGKTSIAASLALYHANHGRKTLVVSTDPAHSLSDAFAQPVGAEIASITANLDALEIDPDRQVEQHIADVLAGMKSLVKPTLYPQIEKQLKLTAQSPGTQEAAILESIAQLIDEREQRGYDLIIFDTAPTGHTLRLLTLPEAMSAWTQGMLQTSDKARQLQGVVDHLSSSRQRAPQHPLAEPKQHDVSELSERNQAIAARLRRRQQLFQRTRDSIKDPQQTAIALVLTPEKLPILETERAVRQLTEQGLPLAGLWINRNLPEHVEGEFMALRRQQEELYREQIKTVFAKIPGAFLPLFARDLDGISGLQQLIEAIADNPLQSL